MKKQRILKKNVFKLFSFLTLFTLTFFISCEKDLDEVSLEKSYAPYKIKIVYGENFFKEHPEIRSEINSKNQLSSQARMISSDYNFEIDETKVQIIESEDYDVFTFEIERDTLINNVLENYILIQHSNDSIEHFIASYPYNIVNGKKVFNNEASISEITNPNLVYSARSVNEHIANPNCEWVPYFSSQTVYIPGERCGCHGKHFFGDSECDCPVSPPTEGTYETVDITTWKYECYSGGGSSDNSGSNPSGSGSVGGSGGSNSNQNIITAPFGKDINIYDNLWQSQTLLLNNLSLEQQNWWNNISISTKNSILNYLNSNNNSNEALDFVLEFMNSSIESGLNLDFEKSLKSPANIDFSTIDKTTPEGQKLDCIYQKLMQSPSFKNLFSDIFGNNDRVNIKFGIKNSSELVDNQGNPVLGQTNTVSIQNDVININVNLNQQFLLNQSPFNFGSNVYIAKVIAHECLHAYLQYIRVHDVNFPNITIPNLNNQTIAQLITSYIDQYHGGYEHNFIANELLPHLANVLNEIKNLTLSSSDISNLGDSTIDLPNAGINNEAFNWDDFFKSLALQGLEKTNYFSNNYHTFNGNNPLSIIQYSNISNSGRYFFYNAKAKNTTTNCN